VVILILIFALRRFAFMGSCQSTAFFCRVIAVLLLVAKGESFKITLVLPMDNLYAVCLEQISLSGFEGISLPYLWKLLSELSLPCPIDIYTKKWIWEQLKANTDQLQFYLSEEETPSLEYVCRGRDRGFCDSNRKTADAVLLSQPLEKLEALKEKFKIVASYELREAALGITQYGLQCTDVQYKILELLAKSRKRGILGSDLADRVGVGPKDLFFQIKTLQKYGIEITKQKVTVPVEGHTSKKNGSNESSSSQSLCRGRITSRS
jgi:hypothetical protein